MESNRKKIDLYDRERKSSHEVSLEQIIKFVKDLKSTDNTIQSRHSTLKTIIHYNKRTSLYEKAF